MGRWIRRVHAAIGTSGTTRERLDAHLATALFRTGQYEQIESVAGLRVGGAGDAEVAGSMVWSLGYALLRETRYEDAIAVVELALARPALAARWTARLHALQALITFGAGRHDEAKRTARLAEREGEGAGDRSAVGYALHLRPMMEERRGDHTTSIATIQRALAVLRDDPETTDLRLMLVGNCSTGLDNLGRVAESDRMIAEALALAQRAGNPARLAPLRVQAARISFYRGRWDDAVAELAAAELPAGLVISLIRGGLAALIAVHRDDRATARRHPLEFRRAAAHGGRGAASRRTHVDGPGALPPNATIRPAARWRGCWTCTTRRRT